MNKSVAKVFNSAAKKYDMQRNELIPLMNIFYGTAVELVNINNEKGKILDLGAGTGLLTELVIKKYPNAEYTLVDIAEEMLDIAKERFELLDNVSFNVEDYRDGISGGKYEAIISSMSIHHLDFNEKRNLYKNIFDILEEGGVFVNADQVKGEDCESEEIVKEYQLSHIENCSLSREEKDKTYERIKLDKMDKMTDQIDMLKEAGFKSVDIYYKYYNYVVFRARK
ncbi:class I SAM-dependent methyltransferase [Clostridium sp.]|uniref:class I SAM-dependent methyltransferase n=1 Tax=Clostridium sp. TaxID=1506 RepID=UPI00261A55D0|nr:class I SAM-dependent methyltransferase [Clostridium sp.]